MMSTMFSDHARQVSEHSRCNRLALDDWGKPGTPFVQPDPLKPAGKIIEKQLKICGYKKDNEVIELFLGENGLNDFPDLSRFRKLRKLWLNNNKIQNLSFLKNNCCLTELYLQNNYIRHIAGNLKNLHSLQILLLHNNQLNELDVTVKELQRLRALHTLNLFNNPLSQDSRYRLYLIYHITSLTLLDRKEITIKERESALHLYNHEKTLVLQSLGFGKRIDVPLLPNVANSLTPKKVLRLPSVSRSDDVMQADDGLNGNCYMVVCRVVGAAVVLPPEALPAPRLAEPCYEDRRGCSMSGYEFGNHLSKIPFENPEEAVFVRAMKRALMEFSTFDWAKMPTCEEKRLGSSPEKKPQKLTVRFR